MPFCSTAWMASRYDLFLVQELFGLLGHQHRVAFRHRHAAGLGPSAESFAENIVQVEHAHLCARHARHVEGRQAAHARIRNLNLDLPVVQRALAQHLAELLAGFRGGIGADQSVEHPVLGPQLGLGFHFLPQPVLGHGDRDLDQIADDLLDVAADIPDFGELGRFDLQKRRLGELGEPARDLGLADTGRADHQDVLGQHLFPQGFRQLEPTPAVAERNRDGALGIVLADNETVQFRNDLAGAEGSHGLFFVRSADGAVHRYDTVIRGRFEPACHYIFSTMTL